MIISIRREEDLVPHLKLEKYHLQGAEKTANDLRKIPNLKENLKKNMLRGRRTHLDGAEEHSVVHSLCAEELLTECCGNRWSILFAAEDIDIGCIGIIGEVSREQGGLDKLRHRVAGDSVVRAEVDDLWFAEALHIDKVGKFQYELVNLFCVTDRCRVTLFQVDRGAKTPAVFFLKLCNDLCVGQVVCCHLFHR